MPQVRILLPVILRNGERLQSADPEIFADLRADAYGHGAEEVAVALADAGWRRMLVSHRSQAAAFRQRFGTRVDVRSGDDPLRSVVSTGAALYGLGESARHAQLESAMTVTAAVVSVKHVQAGEGVSYGHTYRVSRPSNLALIPVGYSDGLHRASSNRGRVLLGGELHPIAGRVAMDVHVLDLGMRTAAPGDEAVLFGTGGQSPDEFAGSFGQAGAELTTGLGMRIPREYR